MITRLFKTSALFFLIGLFSNETFAQKTVGRLALGLEAGYDIHSGPLEKGGLNIGGNFRYFPTSKAALVISVRNYAVSFQNAPTENSFVNTTISLGGEKHFNFNKFSPYLGLEAGLQFSAASSFLMRLPSNSAYVNNSAKYIFVPKAGLFYQLTNHLNLVGEAVLINTFSPGDLAPLYDKNNDNLAPLLSKTNYLLSLGLVFKFNE